MSQPSRRTLFSVMALGLLATLRFDSVATSAEDDVSLTPIKWDAFLAKIKSNKKAKLTLVDAWATWCGPCKENFPHVLEMHKKYAGKGLVVISLSLDDPEKPKKVAEAKEFLVEKNAKITNLILDEAMDDAFEKLNIAAIPAVFVYGPDGKEVKRFTLDDIHNQFTYEDVDKYLAKTLGGK